MYKLIAIATLALTLSGCPKRVYIDGVKSPKSAWPIVIAGLESGMELSYMGGELARSNKDFPGCVAGHAVAAAFATSSEGLRGNLKEPMLPGIEYDVSMCLDLMDGGQPDGVDVPAIIQPLITGALVGIKTIVASQRDSLECEQLAWIEASIQYAQGAAPGIIAEVSAPDGRLAVPPVPVPLERCEED